MLYLAPTDLDDALEALAGESFTVLAGGTDFYPARVGKPLIEPVLDISRLSSLRGIEISAGSYRIGALTHWSEIREAPLPAGFDGLRLAAREVGAAQVQNAGTIGGNLCNASPAADGIPPLLTLEASVELSSTRGARVLPVADFLTGYRQTDLGPDELLTAVIVPRGSEDARSGFLKLGSRRYLVISIAVVASLVALDGEGVITDARFAVGACSPVAQRLPALEAELEHRSVHEELEQIVRPEHLSVLSPIDDVRAPASYRLDSVMTLIRRLLRAVRAPR